MAEPGPGQTMTGQDWAGHWHRGNQLMQTLKSIRNTNFRFGLLIDRHAGDEIEAAKVHNVVEVAQEKINK